MRSSYPFITQSSINAIRTYHHDFSNAAANKRVIELQNLLILSYHFNSNHHSQINLPNRLPEKQLLFIKHQLKSNTPNNKQIEDRK